MSEITVYPRTVSNLNLTWRAPGDKSISQRATFLASLAEGRSRISGILWSEDVVNNLKALISLGVTIDFDGNDLFIKGVGKFGFRKNCKVNLGNSATSSRIMLAFLSGQKSGEFIVDGNEVLRHRPMGWSVNSLRSMGAEIEWIQEVGCLPVKIQGAELKGKVHKLEVSSAQAVSGLLFASLLADSTTRIYRKTLARDHTERMFKFFGIDLFDNGTFVELRPPEKILNHDVLVPGDPSSAAFLIGMVAMYPNKGIELTVENLNLNSTRTGFLEVLKKMGADINIFEKEEICGEPIGNVQICSGRPLSGIQIRGEQFVQSLIDEIPIIAAIASIAQGETVIMDASELSDKDTNRAETTIELLNSFGIQARPIRGGLVISPSKIKSPHFFVCPNDHRIAMVAMMLANQCEEPTMIKNWEVLRVSFPEFIDAFNLFGAALTKEKVKCFGPHLLFEYTVQTKQYMKNEEAY